MLKDVCPYIRKKVQGMDIDNRSKAIATYIFHKMTSNNAKNSTFVVRKTSCDT